MLGTDGAGGRIKLRPGRVDRAPEATAALALSAHAVAAGVREGARGAEDAAAEAAEAAAGGERAVVVGSGPAGLFAALALAEVRGGAEAPLAARRSVTRGEAPAL